MKTLFKITITITVIYLLLFIVAFYPQKTVPAESLAEQESHFIEVEGLKIHYLKQGTGEPVILVHGFAGSGYTFRHLIPYLTKYYTLYIPDLPGFGLSAKPVDYDYGMQAQGDFLLHFMDTLSLKQAVLTGHSMGSLIVSHSAIKAPERIKKLILVEGSFYHSDIPAFLRYMIFPLNRIMARQFYTKKIRAQSLISSFYNKSLVTDEVLANYLQAGKTPGAVAAMAYMMRTVKPEVDHGLGTRITVPTLIVWSENNSNNPVQNGQKLNTEIPGSRLVTVTECGHYIQEEKPQELAKAIWGFLEEENR